MDRVAVFIDYENVHRTGHQMYAGIGQQRYETVVDPVAISERLVAKRRFGGEISAVNVYRGRPVPAHQPRPASANDLQAAAWEAETRFPVSVIRRDLKYDFSEDRSTFIAREKGIDVALAVGLVEGAIRRSFDAAIVFSSDTDLVPAVELAFNLPNAHIELACWTGFKPIWFPEMLNESPPRRMPFCHFLSEQDFLECRDYSAA